MPTRKPSSESTLPLFDEDKVKRWVQSLRHSAQSTAMRLAMTKQLLDDEKELHAAIDFHVQSAMEEQKKNEFVDLDLCQSNAEKGHALVNKLGQLHGAARQIVLVALHYFIFARDGESDFASPIGFEDDKEVIDSAMANVEAFLRASK